MILWRRETLGYFCLLVCLIVFAGGMMCIGFVLYPHLTTIHWSEAEPPTTTTSTSTITTTTLDPEIVFLRAEIGRVEELARRLQEVKPLEPPTTTTSTSTTTTTTFRVQRQGLYYANDLSVPRYTWLHCLDNPWVQLYEEVKFSGKYAVGSMSQWRPVECKTAEEILLKGYSKDDRNRRLIKIQEDHRNGTLGKILYETPQF